MGPTLLLSFFIERSSSSFQFFSLSSGKISRGRTKRGNTQQSFFNASRMEDESDEWMSGEYYPPSSKETNTTSNLRWILNKGYWLGKKVAITGVVISSVPVVLPPLVVISALGFAFSVPFGLVYASYACTEKIMSELLPSPTTSPLLYESEIDSSDEEQDKVQMEDLIELASGELGYDSNNEGEYWPYGIDDYENKSLEVKEEGEKEEGYEEDVGKYLAVEEKAEENFPSEEGKDEEPLIEVTQAVLVMVIEESDEVIMRDEEEEEIVSGSTGLLEKIRDGGEIDGGVKEELKIERKESIKEVNEEPFDDKSAFLENLDDGHNGDIERKEIIEEVNEEPLDDKSAFSENLDDGRSGKFAKGFEEEDVEVEKGTEKESGDKDLKSDEFGGEENGTDGKKRDESGLDVEKRDINEVSGEENEKTFEEKINVKSKKLNAEVNETGDSTLEQKKVNGKVKRRRGKKRGKVSLDEKKLNDDEEEAGNNIVVKPSDNTRVVNGESIEGSGESVGEKKSEYKYNVEDLNAEDKEIAIDQIDTARESAEEKGSDVGDDTRASGVPYAERLGQNEAAEEIADSVELPISKWAESKETNSPARSSEVSLSEEKLWQQIDALRAIVGYKAAHDSTLIGELKALYIFTGVEPPPSFKDPHDLVEVNEKLRFLMSVVGVK